MTCAAFAPPCKVECNPANIYLLKVNDRKTWKGVAYVQRQLPRSGVFKVNFEQINVSWEVSRIYFDLRFQV